MSTRIFISQLQQQVGAFARRPDSIRSLWIALISLAWIALAWHLWLHPEYHFPKYPEHAGRLLGRIPVPIAPFDSSPFPIIWNAFFFDIFDESLSYILIRWNQYIAGAISIFLFDRIGSYWIGPRASFFATLLLIASRPWILHTGMNLPEGHLVMFLLLSSYCCHRLILSKNPIWALNAGLASGLAALARPSAIIFSLIWAVYLSSGPFRPSQSSRFRPWFRSQALLWFGMFFALLPVAIYNFRSTGEWIWVSSSGGWFFCSSHYPDDHPLGLYMPEGTDERRIALSKELPYPLVYTNNQVGHVMAEEAVGRKLGFVEADGYWLRFTIKAMLDDPAGTVSKETRRLGYLLHEYDVQEVPENLFRDLCLQQIPLLGWACFSSGTAIYFLLLLTGRISFKPYTLVLFFSMAAMVIPFALLGRYRFPLVFPLALLAGTALSQCLGEAKSTRAATLLLWCGIAGTTLLLAKYPYPSVRAAKDIEEPRFLAGKRLGIGFIPGHSEMKQGIKLAEAAQDHLAKAFLEKAVSSNPSLADAHYWLGIISLNAAKPAEAADWLAKSLVTRPQWGQGLYFHCIALRLSGQTEQAGKQFEILRKVSPTLADRLATEHGN